MTDLTLPPCPTPCDPDCDADCHEAHQVPSRRGHQPHGCEEIRRAILARAVLMAEAIADPAAVGLMEHTARRFFTKHAGDVRADEREHIAAMIRTQKVPCPDHPMPLPQPSCWTCGRNGAFERAARIAAGLHKEVPGDDT